MSNTKKIYLHIGHFKTATSALQVLLANNRETLARSGIDYPALGIKFPHQHGEILLDYVRKRNNPAALKDYLDKFSKSSYSTLIFSAEAVSNLSAKHIEKLLGLLKKYAAVKVVYMIRHWSTYLASRYQQNIKVCDAWSWQSYIAACQRHFPDFNDINYAINIKVIAQACPGRLSLLYYSPQTAIMDLLHALELEKIIKLPSVPVVNARLSAEVIELTRLLNGVKLRLSNIEDNVALRFNSLLQNKDLPIVPFNHVALAKELFRDETVAACMKNINLSIQKDSIVADKLVFGQWLEVLQAVIDEHKLPVIPDGWRREKGLIQQPMTITPSTNDLPSEFIGLLSAEVEQVQYV